MRIERTGRNQMRILYGLLQWTWGLPQNLLGAVLALLYRSREHSRFRNAYLTNWPKAGCMSLGMFIFLDDHVFPASSSDAACQSSCFRVLIHEYGHSVQSLILGPLYLPVIGLPSLLWSTLPYFRHLRRKKGLSYYKMYQEKWANHLGTRVTRFRAPEQDS